MFQAMKEESVARLEKVETELDQAKERLEQELETIKAQNAELDEATEQVQFMRDELAAEPVERKAREEALVQKEALPKALEKISGTKELYDDFRKYR